jgi:hypothetical protein
MGKETTIAGIIPPQTAAAGMLANGSCGMWDISVDELFSPPRRWCAQIDCKYFALSFDLLTLETVPQIASYLGTQKSSLTSPTDSGLHIGTFNNRPLKLLRDNEHQDRFFFVAGDGSSSLLRIEVSGQDMHDFVTAMQQVDADLNQ